MSDAIQKQLLFEARFTGTAALCLQIKIGENDPKPSEPLIKNLSHMIEGFLNSRGAETGPPIWRSNGRTVEISLCAPAHVIAERVDLFCALESMGVSFRAGQLHADATWETIYPVECTGPFALLADPPDVDEQLAVLDREINALEARLSAVNDRLKRGAISQRDARAQADHVSERVEMLELEQASVRAQSRAELCGGQS